jgi:riboflavin synthase
MFSGIVEQIGTVREILRENENIHFFIEAPMAAELKIDQSVAHNGVCLTVVSVDKYRYQVTAIRETLQKTNLGQLRQGDQINLERCLRLSDRLDGHMVQGHVDTTAVCRDVADENGSWKFLFEYAPGPEWITVPKGSICVNGTSLTVVDSGPSSFSVCIIPYTFENTNFKNLKKDDVVNLEFDVIGKYVLRYLSQTNNHIPSIKHGS